MSNGKGDKYRPVNQHMYDKGWARMIQQCVECVHNKGDHCELPIDTPCEFKQKDKE